MYGVRPINVCWFHHSNDGHKGFVRRYVEGEKVECECVGWSSTNKYIFRDGPVPGIRFFKASVKCCRGIRHRNYKISHGEYLAREIRSEIDDIEVEFNTPSKDIVRRGSRFKVDPWDDYFLPFHKGWKLCLKRCKKQYLKHKKHGPYVDPGVVTCEDDEIET